MSERRADRAMRMTAAGTRRLPVPLAHGKGFREA
jgi:hypothetical protein